MARFQAAFNQDDQKRNATKQRARRNAAAKLAAAVGYGFERLEQRALFNGSAIANPGGPYTVNEGSSITLDGSGSTDNGPITGYKWDLNYNGTFVASVTSMQPTLHYNAGAAIPQRTIALEVVAADGTSSVATTTLNVNDVLPTITVTGGGQVSRGASNSISWSYTDPGNEAVTNWLVDWGDGSGVQTLAGSATSSTHVYSSDGSYTATVTSEQMVLGSQVTSSNTAAFSVVPVIPIVTLTGNAHVNELASYSLGFSAVDPNAIDNWAIDWGDGTPQDILPGTATGSTHTYATHGSYTVTTTAIDDAGDSGQTTKTVIADDVPPAPTTSGGPGQAHIHEGDTVNLTVTPHDPGSLNGTTYAWTVTSTNGSFSLPGNTVTNTASLSFVAGYTGTYTATCTVTDDAGQSTATTTTIIADAVAPTVTLTPGYSTSINKGGTVSLTANPSDPGTNDTYTYAWTATLNGQPYTLPSGSTTGSTFNLLAGRSGTFVATVLVTDRDNGTATANTTSITAAAVAPTETVTGAPSSSIGEGTPVTFTATPTDTGVNESFGYVWTVTKNGNAVNGGSADTGSGGQEAQQAFDGNTSTKWYSNDGGTTGYLQYDFGGTTTPVTRYTLTSANDQPARDPASWQFLGSTDGTTWTTLDTQSAQTFAGRHTTNTYNFANTTSYRYYRLNVTATLGIGGGVQLAELTLSAAGTPLGAWTHGPTLTFTPLDQGTYVASATVTDSDNSSGSGSSSSFTVTDVAPTVAITGAPSASINEGAAVNLTATATSPSTDRFYSYLWTVARTYGGNTTNVALANGTNTSAALSFTPGTEGTYVATCVVTDDEGVSTTQASPSITVATVPATVTITGDTPTEINEGTAVNLAASSTEPGSGHTFNYSWSVSKNGSPYQIGAAGTATASASTGNQSYQPQQAFDGDPNTYWYSLSSTPQYLQYDLGSGQSAVVTQYNISAPFISHAPAAWTLTGSNDASSWTTLDTQSGQTLSSGNHHYSFSNSTAYRYYRLNVSQAYTNGGVVVGELALQDASGNSIINNGNTSAGPTLGFTPTTKGSYVATVTATDEDGHVVSQTSNTITVDNVPPTVTVSGTPNGSIAEGTAVNLTSTATEPGPGGYTYLWTVMNGATPVSLAGNASAATSALSFTPLAEGTYVATLKVTDSEGGITSQSSQNIVVTPVAPAVTMTTVPTSPANEFSPLTFGVTASDVNPANTRTFAWSVTKGGVAYTLPVGTDVTDSTFTFTPDDAGTWIASCTVTNSETQSTTVGSGAITVAAIAPTVAVTLSNGTRAEGTAIAAGSTLTKVGTSDTVSYLWSVKRDGVSYTLPSTVSTTSSSFLFTPEDEGVYQIFLAATDSGGTTNASSSTINVADVAPVVAITGGAQTAAPEGTAITLGTTVTQTGANDSVATYAWTVTKTGGGFTLPVNTVTNASSLTFTPPNLGTYTATVTVTNASDGNITGGQTQQSTTITAVNVPPVVTVTGPASPVNNGATLNYSAAVTEAGNNTLSYAWTVKRNGTTITLPMGTVTNASTLSFNVGRAGTFIATCTVTDSELGVGSGASAALTVNDVPPTVVVSGEPSSSINAGTLVNLSAAATDPGARETFTYAWSVKRNNATYTPAGSPAANLSTYSFTPDKVGTYVATVVVTDTDLGATTQTSQSITVLDVAPTVTVTAPVAPVNEGQTVTFSETATNPTIGDIFTPTWTVTRNNAPFMLPQGTSASGTSLSFVAPEGGTYVATASVSDSAGNAGTNSGTETVNWVAPSVTISGTPANSITAGTAVNLTAAPAEAGSSHTYTYAWTVTRGSTAYTLPNSVNTTGSTLSFNPGRAGDFTATVVVTDEDTQTATASTTAIHVTDVPPAVGISGAPLTSITEGTGVSLTALPTSPGADETFTYVWAVTKGGTAYTLPVNVATTNASLAFTPGVAGSYVASVTVTDLDNGVTTFSTVPIVVTATPVMVSVTGAPSTAINSGTAVSLSASGTNSGPGEQFTYAWTVTLNSQPYPLPTGAASGPNLNFTTTDAGNYVASVVATDTSGTASAANNTTIVVNAVAPTVTITGSGTISEGSPITLTAVPVDANTADTYNYAWSVTKNNVAVTLPLGTVINAATFTFSPPDVGTYVAALTVTDKANLTASTTASVISTDAAPVVTISGTPPAPVNVGVPLNFTSSTTSIGASDTITGYLWSVTKNGAAYTPPGSPSLTGSTFSFTPDAKGTFIVTLAATDNYGQTGTISTSGFTVRPVAPTVTVTGTTGPINEGDPISLTANASDPSTGDTYSYAWTVARTGTGPAWTLPVGVATNLSTLNFSADRTGTYVATVTVIDADTLQTIATSSSIVAADVTPTVVITGVPSTPTPENSGPITLTATPTEPGSGQTYSYLWSVMKGSATYTLPLGTVVNASTFTFTPGRTGSYVATCVVTDVDGGTITGTSSPIAVSAVNPTVTIASTPTTPIGEGTLITRTATATDPGVGDTFSYLWTISKDNSPYTPPVAVSMTGATLAFTPAQPGSYVATCTVTDADNAVGSASTTAVTVTAVNPTVTISTAPTTVGEGTAVNLTATPTSPRYQDTYTYAWAITLNGQAYTPGTVTGANTASLGFTPDQPGAYIATCTVTDIDSAVGTGSSTSIAVTKVNPGVIISGTPSTAINEGSAVNLTTAVTSPRVNDTYTYAWSVKLGGTTITLPTSVATTGPGLIFTPTLKGSYVATVAVTDTDSATTSTATAAFTVSNVAPTIGTIAGLPGSNGLNTGDAFSLSVSPTEPGPAGYTYAWTLVQNGSTIESSSSPTFAGFAELAGSETVNLTVTDSEGGSSQTSSAFNVRDVAPVVSITGAPLAGSSPEGTAISLGSTATDVGTQYGETLSDAWTVTQNNNPYPVTNSSGSTFSFTPNQPGTYVATLNVSDSKGGSTPASTTITVTSVPPTVTLSGTPTHPIAEGTALNLTAAATSPRVNDTFTYAWSIARNGTTLLLPNGVITNASTFNYTPTVAGPYIATCVVTDVDSATKSTSTGTIMVHTVAPTVSISGLPTSDLNTGDAFALTAVATEPGAGAYTYAWTLSQNGSTIQTGNASTFSGTAGLSGPYQVHLTVTDAENAAGTASATFNVDDVAPTISITGSPVSSAEGTTINLGSTATDPGTTIGETLAYSWTVTQDGNSYAVSNAASSSFLFTPDVHGTYVATLTVTDSQGAQTTASTSVNVTNVAPTSTLAAVATTLRNVPVTFSGTLADAGTADTHTIVWNYGDGTSQTFADTDPNALTPTHTYATAGQFNATMTVTDSAGGSSVSSQSVNIVGAMVTTDPLDSTKTALIVNGTSGNDTIKLTPVTGNRIKVTVNGTSLGSFAATGHIIAEGFAGDDTITVAAGISNTAILYGDAGNDTLIAGSANTVLIGGAGNDTLTGGAGADILIGGVGKDVLNGGGGNDMLIGGDSPFATNQAAIGAIDAQWTRTDETFAHVVHQLRGVETGTLSGSYLLNSSTIIDDNQGDFLTGGTGRDWFLNGTGDQVTDYTASSDVENANAVSGAKVPAKK